jgi:hypothetical protein|tara:strand:+ start:29 stop:349 length:321 start_codon:yes stop_codon:yes gene_type:complete
MRKKAPFTSQYADGSGMGVQGYKKGGKTSKKGGASVDSKLAAKAANSRFSKSTLKKVYKRGLGAYASSGSRPGMSAHQWAMARVNSFIKGGHSQDNDLKGGGKKKK